MHAQPAVHRPVHVRFRESPEFYSGEDAHFVRDVIHALGRRDEAVIFDTLALSVYAANRNPRRPPA